MLALGPQINCTFQISQILCLCLFLMQHLPVLCKFPAGEVPHDRMH